MSNNKDLAFIVSGGRTGTQLFGHNLSDFIDGCFSVHEPDVLVWPKLKSLRRIAIFGLWHMVGGRLMGQTGARVIGQKLICGEISGDQARAYIRSSRCRYHESIQQPLIVESNGQWWALIRELHDVWPQAKFAVIIRDPRNWVRSWMNKTGRYDDRDWVLRLPPGRLTPEKVGDADWIERWDAIGTFGRLAWEWSFLNRRMLTSIEGLANARVYRFEDIFSADRSAIHDLIEFLSTYRNRHYASHDVETLIKTVRNSSAGDVPSWRSWSRQQAQLMEELCGTLMRQFDYGVEPEWQDLLR